MYTANEYRYGFHVTSYRWREGRKAKVTWIEFAVEGKPLEGDPPYFGGFLNPPGHPRAGEKMGPRQVRLEADWMDGGYSIIESGGQGGWEMVT